MNYSKLPRQLIYTNRLSLDEFGVDDEKTVNGVIFDRISSIDGLQSRYVDMEKSLLDIFNDAYYICTLIMVEQRPALRFSDFERIAGSDMSATARRGNTVLSMVLYIINHIDGSLNRYQKAARERITDYFRNIDEEEQVNFPIDTPYSGIKKLPLDIFAPCPITPTKLVGVDWKSCSDNFNFDSIRELVVELGKNKKEQLLIVDAIEKYINKIVKEALPF